MMATTLAEMAATKPRRRPALAEMATTKPGGEPLSLSRMADTEVAEPPAFDPEGTGYDDASAAQYGLAADETGHFPSRVPQTGLLLKGRGHKTWPLTVAGEEEAGYEIHKGQDGRYYSRPRQIDWTQEPMIDPRTMPVARMELPLPTAGADPTSVGPQTEPPAMEPSLAGRAAKQYVNRAVLDLAEKSRPSSNVVEAVSLMSQVTEDLESLPDDPTFWQGVKSIPKIWWSLVSNYYAPKGKGERAYAAGELKKLRPGVDFDVPLAETAGEKAVDVVAGIGAFVTQLLVAKKLIPPGTVLSDAVAWEILNQAEGGIPGKGAAVQGSLGAISKIPTVTTGGKALKITAGGGLFGGLTAAEGGSLEDIAVSAAIGAGFQGWGIYKQAQWLKSFKGELLKAEKARVQGKKSSGMARNTEKYHQDLAAAKTEPQRAKAASDYQKRNMAVTRNVNTEIQRAAKSVDKAMDVVSRKLHHGKLEGREGELAKEIVEKGLTPEAVAEAGKVKLPATKGEKTFSKAHSRALRDIASGDPKRVAAGNRVLDFLSKKAVGSGQKSIEDVKVGKKTPAKSAAKQPSHYIEATDPTTDRKMVVPADQSFKIPEGWTTRNVPFAATTAQPVKPQPAKQPAEVEQQQIEPSKALEATEGALNKAQQRNVDALAKYPNADVVEGTMRVRMKNAEGDVFQVPAGQIEEKLGKGYTLAEKPAPVAPVEAAKPPQDTKRPVGPPETPAPIKKQVAPTKAQRQHKAAVEQLWKKGKPVAQDLREMYPDLVAKYEIKNGWDMTPDEIRAWSNEDEKRTAAIEHMADQDDSDWNEIEQRQEEIELAPSSTKAQRDELKELFKQGDQLIADFLAGNDNPRVAEKIAPKEDRGHSPSHFEEGQQVTDIYTGETYRVGKTSRGVARMINVKTGKVRLFNAHANDRFALVAGPVLAGPAKTPANKVMREARDADGNKLGTLSASYDGTPEDAVAKARQISKEMSEKWPEASNIQSQIGATDEKGDAKFTISQNFKVVDAVLPRPPAATEGEKPLDKPAESGIISTEVKHEQEVDKARPGRVRADSVPALEKAPPDTVQPPQGTGGTVRAPQGGGEPSRVVHGAGEEAGAGSPGVAGDSKSDMAYPVRRTERPSARSGDYRVTEADNIGAGGAKTKYRNNIKAITLLKKIESENRKATPEEQSVLVKYVGWGGMPQVFDSYNDKWSKEHAQLRDALDDDEYRAARASTPNAHYTSPAIISSMWEGLKELGFEGGKINEPSMGSGLFYGLMPQDIAANSQLYGGELDFISGRIAQQLYQSARIQVKGFEKTSYADDFFDLFISNVPFGDYKIHDDELRKVKFSIHDYFFAKALKKTRPGGLVVFITSKSSMDKVNSSVRRYLARHADLVGAIRLPKNTFKAIANTEVVTDILVFQKRDPKKFYAGETFESTTEIGRGNQKYTVNEYFAKHPDHILGRLSNTGSMYRADEMTVEPVKDINVPARVREIISGLALPEKLNAAQDARNADRNTPSYSAPAPDHVKEGAFVVKEGQILRRRGDELVPADIKGATGPRIKKLIVVRDAARDLLHKQLDPEATDKEIKAARKKLNVAYDSVTKKHGPLSAPYNQRVFRDDPDSPLLLALEHYDPETKEVTSKAAIFTERTQTPHKEIEHVDTAEEALHASLNEKGRIDIPRMAELLGQSEDEVLSELADTLIYKDPVTGRWEPSAMYLSGNVRRKLELAEAAGSEYAANVKALKEVIPDDIPPGNIGVRLGSSWIPQDDYAAFVKHVIGHRRGIKVSKIESEGQWVLGGGGTAPEWETSRFDTLYLIESAMNQRQVTAYDRDSDGNRHVNQDETVAGRTMQQKLRDEFTRWLWDDDARTERLVRIYNDTFNTTVFPQWDGSYLTLPGKVDHIKLRAHQKDVISRFLTHGNLLMAHAVGAGKTFAGVGMAMEARRLGAVKKPLFVVPNHKVEDWATDWLTLYPSANILFATQDDFKPKNRQRLMNKIATGDWDGVIVPMSSFEKIPMHPDVVREFMATQIDDMEAEVRAAKAESGETRSLVKELEKSKKRLEALLERQEAKWKKDTGPYFNELGIDMLFVDEAHEYKNLWFRTQMTRVPGVSQNFVQKTFDLLIKTQYINRITENKGVVFATGTPITNSVTEMFTMQRYLQPDELADKGSQSFDFWARNFGEITSSVEVTPTGSGFRVHDRFNKFTNVPELMQMFRMVTDIQTAKMLKLPVPKVKGGGARTMSAPESDAIHEYVQSLVARVERMKSQKIDPSVDNMLKVTGDGRHAALDIRLRVSVAPDSPTSKVNMAVDNVYQIWKDTTKTKGVQVIWCDLSTPKPGRFSIYSDIKSKLIERGIPADEIGFIHDVKDKKKLPSFFKRAVDGKTRVVLASTIKMGTGANIQKRLVAAHHIDPPWRPADIEQRDGRIVRQGNTNEEVQIYRYVTKGSFDAYMWQTLETKARFIEQVMTGETTARDMEDVGDSGALSYAEVKAIASGNPKVMEAVKLDAEVKEMQALERAHHNEQYAIRAKVKHSLPADIAYQHKRHDGITKDLVRYQKAKDAAGDDLDFTFGGKGYAKRKQAGRAMLAVLGDLNKLADQEYDIGTAFGFNLSAKWLTHFDKGGWWHLTINGIERYSFDVSDSPEGSITTVLNQFKAMGGNAKGAAARAANLEKRLAQLKEKLGGPFGKAEDLKNKSAKLAALQQEIGMDEASRQANEPLVVAGREDVAESSGGTTIGAPVEVGRRRMKVSMEPEGKVQSATEIVRYVERAFNIPVRGRATHTGKRALGWFDAKAVGIRLKDVQSITTAMHETGHHIDWTLSKRMSLKPPPGIKGELMALGRALYGSRKPPGGYKSEGWAEFIRMHLTGDDTRAEAPNLHEWFHDTYLPSHRDIARKLAKLQDMITRWRMQGAEARIESQINRKVLKGTIGQRMERGILWLDTMFRDEFASIRKVVKAAGEELNPSLDPYQLAIAHADKAGSIARQMVLEYTTNMAGEYTGPGLREVIKPVRKDIKAFTRYLIAARGIDLFERGKSPGIRKDDAEYVFGKYDSELWRKTAKAVTDWNHRVLDYLVEAGGLEPDVAEHMKELNPVYIPFMRAFMVGELRASSGPGWGITNVGKGVKSIKGSGRQLIDPMESMIQQAEKLISVAHKVDVARALAKLADKPGMAKWIWEVPAPKQATRFAADQIKKDITRIATERLGMDPDAIPDSAFLDQWDDVLTVFTNAGQFYGKENIVAVVIDGKKQFYEVHPQLYRALEGLDQYTLPPILNVLFGKPNRAVRLGATGLNAAFGVIRNPVRDAMTFTVLAKHAKGGPFSAATGIAKDILGTPVAKKFKALGGQMSGQIMHDRTATQHLRGELLATTIGRKTIYHATHPINALRELFGVTEAGTRIGEFGPALKYAEKKWGKGSKDAAIYGINAGQDVTTNFTRHGKVSKVLNQMIPFFNAGIQGPDKILRTFRERPITTLIKALAFLTLPAIYLWWKNKDKKWYKNLPVYEKVNYLHVEVPGEDKIIRIPVPFELGHVFQSIPVAVLDQHYQEYPDAVKDAMEEVFARANPFDWPAVIGPTIDIIGNEDFAGRPIVSRSMEGMLPEDRVSSHTTALMKELGKILNVSPAQLEHLVNSYSGGLYKRTSRVTYRKGDAPSDMPVIGTLFTRDPFAPKAQVEKFYDRSDLLDQKNQSNQITPAENRERLRLGRIRRKLTPLWKNLHKVETMRQRKQIWTKIETEIKKAD